MGTFFVSESGSDSADGRTLNSAFRTVEKAFAAMSASAGPDTILIRGGTYEIKSPLVMTSADNGTTIQAYGNEKAVLLGGHVVTGWTQGANGIWTAPLAQADLHQLTLNGERMTEARFPNAVPSDPIKAGWLWANAAPAGINPLTQMAFDKALLSPSQLQAGMKIHLFTDASWAEVDLTVKSVNWTTGVITFVESAPYDIGAASRFYVHDGKVHLDQQGEWWFDAATKTINFKAPPGFDGKGVVASGNQSILDIDGASGVTISGLTFSDVGTGADSADIQTAAIKITASSNIVITGNKFANVVKGVETTYHSDHISVINNDFAHIWSSAIQLGHQSSQNTISGNIIWRAGEFFATFGAIDMAENWGNLIADNLIRDVPRNGIQGVNYDGNLKSGGNTIEDNIIVHSSQSTSDSAGIYFYSKPDDTHLGEIIRNNIIVDTGGLETTAGGFLPDQNYTNGVYLDDNTSRAQVYNNFVQGSVVGGVYIHGGSGNSVFNNVLLANRSVGVQLFDIGKPMTGNNVYGNIIETPLGSGFVVQNNFRNPAEPASVHDNFVLNASGIPISFQLAYSTKTLAQWQALGFDVGTDVISSGIFVDPSSGNFALKAGVLPLQQGFGSLPLASMQSFRDGVFKWGTDGADNLSGGTGGDLLEGLLGDDRLSGGGGADTLDGGAGSDMAIFTGSRESYQIAVRSGGTVIVTDMRGGSPDGTDTIDRVEILQFTDGTFNVATRVFTPTGNGHIYTGTSAADSFNPALSTPVLFRTTANADVVYALSGNDKINGGGGSDTLYGGLGDDSYYVDSTGDQTIEQAGEGTDTVFAALGWTLGENVENLKLLNGTALIATGNALNNSLTGNTSANTLTGLAGNDRLDGKAGADTMIGGSGNDSYLVDNAGDTLTELSGGGTDTVFAVVNTSLAPWLDNLVLAGTGAINGTGNSIANTISGNGSANHLVGLAGTDVLNGGGGNDTLAGGLGADTLIGGAGTDTFEFDKSSFGAADTVTDFVRGVDRLKFDDLDLGITTAAGNLQIVTSLAPNATLGHAQFLFNTATRTLLWDADGIAGGHVAIAKLSVETLSATDFVIA